MTETTGQYTKNEIDAIAVIGSNYYEQGKLNDAEIMFKGLVTMADSYYGHAGLGAVALAKNPPDLDRAFTELSKAAEQNPEDPAVHANLGEVLLRQAKFDEAGKELRHAIDLDPEQTNPGANRARAMVLALKNLVDEYHKSRAEAK